MYPMVVVQGTSTPSSGMAARSWSTIERLRTDRAQRRVDLAAERADLGAAIGARGSRRVRSSASSAASVGAASPTTGTASGRWMPISAGSTSTCTTGVPAGSALPMRCVPTARTTSASSSSGCRRLVHPRRARVERVAGVEAALALAGGDDRRPAGTRRARRARRWRRRAPRRRRPRSPGARRRRAGRRRASISSGSAATRTRSAGFAQRDRRPTRRTPRAASRSRPAAGARAARARTPRARCRGSRRRRSARRCHSVIGRTRSSWSSISCSRPRCWPMPARFTCPAMSTTGEDERERGGQPGAGVVDADAGHHERHAGATAAAGVAVGQVGGALLVAGGDEADRRLVVEARRGRAWSGRRGARTRA